MAPDKIVWSRRSERSKFSWKFRLVRYFASVCRADARLPELPILGSGYFELT
jgi:hypothetical protein